MVTDFETFGSGGQRQDVPIDPVGGTVDVTEDEVVITYSEGDVGVKVFYDVIEKSDEPPN
jgi:hypothetical protein